MNEPKRLRTAAPPSRFDQSPHGDCRERDRLLTQMKFLPDGPERTVVGKQRWDLPNKVADLYAPRRSQPLAAADSES